MTNRREFMGLSAAALLGARAIEPISEASVIAAAFDPDAGWNGLPWTANG